MRTRRNYSKISEDVFKVYDPNLNVTQMSLKLEGVTPQVVYNILKRHHLPHRPGERKSYKVCMERKGREHRKKTAAMIDSHYSQIEVNAWIAGDSQAYGRLYAIAFPYLVKRAVHFGFSKQEAEDLASYCMERVYKYIHTYNSEKSKFYTWVHTVMNNVCFAYMKHNHYLDFKTMPQVRDKVLSEYVEDDYVPEMSLERKKQVKFVMDHLGILNPRMQKTMEMWLSGCNNEEIMLKMQYKTIQSTVGTIRSALKQLKRQIPEMYASNSGTPASNK